MKLIWPSLGDLYWLDTLYELQDIGADDAVQNNINLRPHLKQTLRQILLLQLIHTN